MAKYERAFVKHGFDDLEFIVSLRQTLNSSKEPLIMNFINAHATLAQRQANENILGQIFFFQLLLLLL